MNIFNKKIILFYFFAYLSLLLDFIRNTKVVDGEAGGS